MSDNNADFFYKAVSLLQNSEECRAFFEDICTVQEIRAISQRLNVANLLNEKQVYNDIVKTTGASTATVSRVNRSLKYGNDGYAIVFERMKN